MHTIPIGHRMIQELITTWMPTLYDESQPATEENKSLYIQLQTVLFQSLDHIQINAIERPLYKH